MGKTTGFLDYERKTSKALPCEERIKNFDEFHIRLSKAQQREQGARCMDCGVPFCQWGQQIKGMYSGCPLNNLIPEWNDLVYRGHYEQAHKRLKRTNNFPEFTSRVCPALCEKACTCGLNGDSVTVRENEYAIIEYAYDHLLEEPQPPLTRVGKKVAIIGSGPSGLACADQLNHRGYECHVYERDDRIGGLLMYGIPNMKIEKNIVDRRMYKMKAEGVKFFTNSNITTKEQAQEMLNDYDAVVLAVGAKAPRDINVEGREAPNIYFAVDYLTSVTKSLLNSDLKDQAYPKGKNVLVIGGGDTGNDCVGTAIRLGAESVTQLEMMGEPPIERAETNPWPEWPLVKKTDYGQEEAIDCFGHDPRIYNTTVKSFIHDEAGLVKQAVIVKLKWDVIDGKRTMSEVPGSEEVIDCDLVLIAAGFVGAQTPVMEAFDITLDRRQTVACEADEHRTNVDHVYAAGDCRRGQSLVVWAIREGRDAAACVDYDLMGYTSLDK